jgi:hypothetical protein
MSLVKVSGNASGTGTLTIAAPNTNSDYTLTLPQATTTFVGTDATQTLTNKTLTTPNIDSAQFATVSGTAPIYPCRAWVNFNGTGTVAIRGSGNVSSITDNGTGDYTINFTIAMTDANYAVCGSAFGNVVHSIMSPDGTPSTTAVQVITSNTTAVGDNSVVAVAIFR